MNEVFWTNMWRYFNGIIGPSITSTLRMLVATMILALVFGFFLAIALYVTNDAGLKPNKKVYGILSFLVNTVRSFPIIILIVAISPVTRMLVGTTIGEKAAIFPLALAAIPFLARILETAFLQVDRQVIEAAYSFGAAPWQIMLYVVVKESVPSIISGTTLATITYLSATTMAGAVGAGGIGAVALNYGYQSFNDMILYTSVFILLIMVYIIQIAGDRLYKRCDLKNGRN